MTQLESLRTATPWLGPGQGLCLAGPACSARDSDGQTTQAARRCGGCTTAAAVARRTFLTVIGGDFPDGHIATVIETLYGARVWGVEPRWEVPSRDGPKLPSPSRRTAPGVYMSIPCCGDPELCGSQNCFDNAPSPTPVENERKVSCSEAWRQLKAHPNIGLANLQLLADVVARKSAPHSSSSSSIDQNASSIYHQQGHPHEGESSSSWPSSQSMLENEDSIFSPHVTLSTVFENTHNDFDDEDHSYHHQQQRENTSLSSKDSLNNNHLSSFDGAFSHHRQQQQHDLSSSNETHPSSGKKVKFVEKESLDQALRMLDRAI
ncbi:hypothetical protein PGT21_019829 [Puccinia graminis f. sp. tritici]|uniref:Uncharacterized protein n=1 Tax=Puccinia graminis f. sp. tritici TaxID=56615 RepID=A0A5B0QAR4_PUCGR|nr:hypothetical protein PGT21_019829 [Puccinia graminis f. sp. tritici]